MEKEIKRLLRCFKRTELSEQDVTDALLKLIESSKVVLPQADVIKSVCPPHNFYYNGGIKKLKCANCNETKDV